MKIFKSIPCCLAWFGLLLVTGGLPGAAADRQAILVCAAKSAPPEIQQLADSLAAEAKTALPLQAMLQSHCATGVQRKTSEEVLANQDIAACNHLVVIGLPSSDPLMKKIWEHYITMDEKERTAYAQGWGYLKGDLGYIEADRNPFLHSQRIKEAPFETAVVKITGNSLAGVQGGARQVEVAINGMGERAGNAALEEVVMALKVRGDRLLFETGVQTQHITRASRYVSAITGFPVQYNKAIVGKNAFAHESGIHQDGMLKNAETYEIMRPEDVGQGGTNLVMGKHSGRHAFREKLKGLGYELGQNALNEAFQRFKDLADKKKDVFDEDIVALVDDALASGADRIQVKSLRVVAGTEGPQTADLVLTVDGEERIAAATGDGPVDAVFHAIRKAVPHESDLRLFQVHAVTEGTDAQAQVSVRLEEDGRIATGQAADTDTLTASAKAYVNALNNLIARRERSAPGARVASGF